MEKNTRYIIRIRIQERVLTYKCLLLDEDDFLITFKDKFGKIYTYNKGDILSAEEISE